MKKILKTITILSLLVSCGRNSISEADRKKALELNNEAVQLVLKRDTLKAKELYIQAKNLDPDNWAYRGTLIGIYSREKEFEKAFGLLEELSEKQKNSVAYYQAKANIHDMKGELKKAKENYMEAYSRIEGINIKNEMDLNTLIVNTTLQTLAGQKDKAVEEINGTLELDWLTPQNIEFLERFRNEFEFYQGGGFKEFDFQRDIEICTKNVDSLKKVLRNNHINPSGSSSTVGEYGGSIFIANKFRKGIENLGLKECNKNAPQHGV